MVSPRSAGDYVEGFRHVALDEVGSTNSLCMEKARDGDPGLLWITARRQSQGRGRRSRAWISEPGNLYASLLLIDPAPMTELVSLPLAAALSVYRAIAAEMPYGGERVSIKWPNDVMVDGAKVSGILVETERLADGRQAVVIGCGINVRHKPENPLYPAITLQEAGSSASAETLFAQLLLAFAETLAEWDCGRGVKTVVEAWKRHVRGIGAPITVNLPDRSISGIFAGIEQDGLLVLSLANGETMRIASGDVFFPTQ